MEDIPAQSRHLNRGAESSFSSTTFKFECNFLLMNHLLRTKDYIRWRSEYERVYDKCIRTYLSNPPPRPVKIAILDTGIDRDHDAFEAREENIKAKLNFYNNSQRSIPDLNGHGTFTASLILDYAPDAELYIAKIADKENATPNAKIVVDVSRRAAYHLHMQTQN